jgi:ABC-type sugar transport system ATPase subunit
VTALDGVSMGFLRGKVTAVVGENGAGKSTLMTILAGLQRPDAGSVTIGTNEVKVFAPQNLLGEHAVALVPQEIALCRDRTVAQNVMLGREQGLVPSRRRMVAETASLLGSIDAAIDPLRRVGSLSIAEQQLVLIARALARECEILILDEPTTSLTTEEVDRLFVLLRRLRESGTTIVYVSHRLPEIVSISDAIHVLRDGSLVGTFDRGDVDPGILVRTMVGRALVERAEAEDRVTGSLVLQARGLTGKGFEDVALEISAGEIVGLAGLPDAGRTQVLAALFGALAAAGTIELDGSPLRLHTPRDAIRAGIGYVPAERRSEGIFPALDVATNLAMLELGSVSRFGVVRRSAIARLAEERLETGGIRGRARGRITQLSGGNQQKVILSRWLARNPRVLLLDEPTRGIDVGAKSDIHERLRASARQGAAILMSSSDLPELLRACDRIVVMAHGRVVASVDALTATEDSVMALATGVEQRAA